MTGRDATSLTDAQRRRVDEVLSAALEQPASARRACVERACADDAAVLAEALSLLAHAEDDSLGTFLEEPPALPAEAADAVAAALPERLGQYEIREVLATGGMGIVYLAEQTSPRRQVALKVIRPGLTTPEMIRRFEHEAAVLARLQHPGIAQIYEAGTVEVSGDRQLFFAMELVRGRTLLEHVEQASLDECPRLALLARICDAVHHAHQKGVIHRDLKPANILVDEHGRPRILDFGIARATDSDLHTVSLRTDVGQLLGTVPYMSPEQVTGDSSLVDIRCDVYALGVIGYELLTGRLPYDVRRKMIHEAARIIREEEPTRLSAVSRALRGDVETIIFKALEKDPERRYPSAADLAADLRRYLHDEPIVARPPTTFYQLRKFARRNRVLVASLASIFVVLLGAAIVATSLAVRAARAEADALRQAEKATSINRFLTEMFAGIDPAGSGREVRVGELVEQAASEIEATFAEQPLVEADVRNEVGTIYYALGMREEAAAQFARVLELREAHLPGHDPEVLKALNNLGQASAALGRGEEAETLYRRALEGRRRVLGVRHDATLETMNNLGMLLTASGRPDEGEALLREAYEAQRDVLGPDHRDTLTSLNNIANILRDREEYEEAEPLLRQCVEGLERTLGPNHATTCVAKDNYARVLRRLDRVDEALEMYRQSLAGILTTLGEAHPSTLIVRHNYAQTLRAAERYDEAIEHYQAALDGFRAQCDGCESSSTVTVRRNLARAHRESGDLVTAERLYAACVVAIEEVRGPDSGAADAFRLDQARCLLELDRLDEAGRVLLEAFEHSLRVSGAGHRRTRESAALLADLYLRQQRPDEAGVWRARSEADEPG